LALLLLAVLLLTSPYLLGQNVPFDVGIKVGERIPAFKLGDQDGNLRDFDSVKGPKGVVLLFFRSADW